jgi:hypothetical protein
MTCGCNLIARGHAVKLGHRPGNHWHEASGD